MRDLYYLCIIVAIAAGCNRENEYDACGNFEATEVMVSSQGTGQVIWFDALEGDLLDEGMEVGLVDTIQLHYQKVQTEAQMKSILASTPDIERQVSSLRSQIAKQKTEKERVVRLIERKAAPQKQLDDIDAQIEVLEKQLSAQLSSLSRNSSAISFNALSLDASISMIEDRIAKCRIVSPVRGTVLAKYVSKGELVTVGTPVMKVADLEHIYLRAYFTSDQLSQIKIGDEVKVTADFGGDSSFSIPGKVVWISPESEFTPKAIQTKASRANLVYAVKIAVENDGRLKTGMYGTVKI